MLCVRLVCQKDQSVYSKAWTTKAGEAFTFLSPTGQNQKLTSFYWSSQNFTLNSRSKNWLGPGSHWDGLGAFVASPSTPQLDPAPPGRHVVHPHGPHGAPSFGAAPGAMVDPTSSRYLVTRCIAASNKVPYY